MFLFSRVSRGIPIVLLEVLTDGIARNGVYIHGVLDIPRKKSR